MPGIDLRESPLRHARCAGHHSESGNGPHRIPLVKYDKDRRDARAFGFPPAFFMSMRQQELAHGQSANDAHETASTRVPTRRYQTASIAVGAGVVAMAVALAAALL